MKKAAVIMLTLAILFTGCQGGKQNNEEVNGESPVSSVVQKIDTKQVLSLTTAFMSDVQKELTPEDEAVLNEITYEMDNAEGDAKKLCAMMLATDISVGQTGMVSKDLLLYLAGKALESYPEHPLVVNNSASVLFDYKKTDAAIALYKQALKAAPQNPVILTNLANAYIQKGDFASAEKSARQSLSCDPEYSAAYQVLTTVHLENKDDILAAETMVKSTKNCFNDVSIAQFESFLSEVLLLEASDEYPLKEAFLDELYSLAKQDAEMINDTIDTPEGQIKVQPFPQIATVEAFMESIDKLSVQEKTIYEMMDDAKKRLMDKDTVSQSEKYIKGRVRNSNGVYPVRASLKQIFAFKVLTSFYEHKLKQAYENYKTKNDKEYDAYQEKLSKLEEELSKKEENLPDTAEGAKLGLHNYSKYMNQAKELNGQYYPKYYNTTKDYYNEIKQIVEEYWLRSGGMLKYVSDEATFKTLIAERDYLIFSNIYIPVSGLPMAAWTFKFQKELSEEWDDAIGKNNPDTSAANAEIYMKPDVEYPPLPLFEEKNDKGMSFDFSVVSMEYKNREFSVKVSTPFSTHFYKKSFYDGRTTTASAYGVTPFVGALSKAIMGQDRYKKLQAKAWQYGINLPDKPEEGKKGQFITRDSKGRVVNRGIYNVKEASIGIPGVEGASVSVSRESMTSFITGVTEVSKSKSIGFTNLKFQQ